MKTALNVFWQNSFSRNNFPSVNIVKKIQNVKKKKILVAHDTPVPA
jgi:hypothetical protein